MTASPARILVLTATVLLCLDAARSWQARTGAGEPTLRRSPGDEQSAAFPWPPGRAVSASASPGERTYARHCAVCHGLSGTGDGPVASRLHPRPRDFTNGVFKIKSTPGRQPPTLADLRATVRNGLQGTSMAGWADLLSEAEIDAVAEHVLSLGPHESWGQAPPLPAATRQALVGGDPENGAAVYANLGCPACHGPEGEGDGSSAPYLKDIWNQPAPPRNLRKPWTFRRSSAAEEVYLRIAYGVSGSPMPAYSDVASPEELGDLVAYVRSIAKTPPWEDEGPLSEPSAQPPVERGKYLVRIALCSSCHTPFDAAGIDRSDTHDLAGGTRVDVRGHGVFIAPNLTPDPETGLGPWSQARLAEALRTGNAAGKRLHPWMSPSRTRGALTKADADAVAAYLKTIPPVKNYVAQGAAVGFLERSIAALLSTGRASSAGRIVVHSGNRGSAAPLPLPALSGSLLMTAQGVVLSAGFLTLLLLPASALRGRVTAALFALAIAATVWFFSSSPLEPAASDPGAQVGNALSPQASSRLRVRGKYLYRVTACGACHAADAAGGAKLNWHIFGTVWAGNLTPAPAGLGAWSDAEVLRFLASGVRRDGSAAHWRSAAWAHSANFSVEDRRALLAYLRDLPAVQRRVPAARPPQGGDSEAFVVWPHALDR